MGRQGRCYVEKYFDRDTLARQYRKLLDAPAAAMRLLVTGGSGFLGGYVLREAAGRGHQTLALARSAAAGRSVAASGAQPLAGDLDEPGGLDEAFAAARCDALVCLASLGRGHGPAIVAAAEEAGIPRAVFVSTTAVTTTLDPPTKQVRLAAEQQIRGSGLDWTILRPTMIYGAPGDRNLSRLLLLLRRTPVLPVPGGRRLPAPAGARGRRRRRRARRAAAARGDRLAVQRGRARAAPVRGTAADLRPGGRQQDPAGARSRWPRW